MEILGILLLVVAAMALAALFTSRCPSCKRWLALRFVDRERTVDKLGVAIRQRQVRCKFCGHSLWRNASQASSGGGNGGD